MQQRIQDDVSLTLAREGNDQELAMSYATIDGRTSGEPLEGIVLEACVQHGNQYLLFLTDNIPFEDSLHIHLLDENLNRIDSATLGGAYTTGHFRNPTCEDSGKTTFEFFEDCVWELSVLANRRLRLPFVSGPPGVSWQGGWLHMLELKPRK
jgi:hypothetical protein